MPFMSTSSSQDAIPSGTIVMWAGTVASIPNGYAFCDGQNGTPDLRDRFVVCARQDDGGVAKANPDESTLRQSGGDPEHLHLLWTVGHTHSIPQEGSADAGSGLAVGALETEYNYDEGYTDAVSNAPPFYALAYIMKL